MPSKLLAILGRGVQILDPKADPTDVTSYAPTEDLEICKRDPENQRLSHLRVRIPADDDHPDSIIGGGELNLLAGLVLIRDLHFNYAVCAYGHRSGYLKPDGPSESEVMSRWLDEQFSFPSEIRIWSRNRELSTPSNTAQEFINILDLAVDLKCTGVVITTIGVHVPRAAVFLGHAIAQGGTKYGELSPPVLLRSEEVLLAADPEKWGSRVKQLRESKSFARNWEREAIGMRDWVLDQY